ncbi:MAG: UDP-N-acetylglucosamine--N-acetylmuramyl-(pentapeptide) pyrophosphoryl-undecaprenol N-acetylglucosamine transferase [Gemmatimonadetes bacterium]|nr:UDP-N-acetylglucosamine--N-acetylmuramyl-(pentapeptide) pyrophosphoryl-undecaprenol N-acetylglucosamine transferase [Gemmatimonadota bacterium]
MNILFAGGGTGGHLYPAIAIARAMIRRDASVHAHFVGALRGIERDVLPGTEFSHTLVNAHPLYRSEPWKNWRTLTGGVSAWRDVGRLASEFKPRVVVGTGGYASGAALAWAATHRLPIVQHIGDSHPGATARLFARFSTEAYLGFPEAEHFLPRGRCRYLDTGNPIEPPPDIRPGPDEARALWGFPASARVLLAFGASQGARAINLATLGFIERGLPSSLCVLWVTGKAHYDLYRSLDRPDVRVVPYISPMATAYAAADIALSRGGMMSTAELCAWGVPTIICPLPTAAHDHQTANAVALERAGAAMHLPQSALTPERLADEVAKLLGDGPRLAELGRRALARARPRAADDIAVHILALASDAAH